MQSFKKAPTREVFAWILQVLNEALTEEEFANKIFSNVSGKKSLKDLDLQSFTKYLGLTLVFMRISALLEKFNFFFSRVFC